MKDYSILLDGINSCISDFNVFLKPEYQIDLLDKLDKNRYSSLKEIPWKDLRWPNSESRGVYFIFGRKVDDANKLGVYIGKASCNSKIGKRIDRHINSPAREEMNYFINGRNHERYSMEYVTSIALDNDTEINFLIAALEELIISKMSREHNLLNSVGVN